jgi:hypothetical protein
VGEVVASMGDLLRRYAEVFCELVVGLVCDHGELLRWNQRLARVALAAVREIAARLAR